MGPDNSISILGGNRLKKSFGSHCQHCVKGNCRNKRHQMQLLEAPCSSSSSSCSPLPHGQIGHHLPPTSTPEFADDEASEDGRDEKRKFQNRFFNVPKARIPPVGKEKVSPICGDAKCSDPYCSGAKTFLERDETMDSIKGVSGSMVDLVKGAREVRKLIREASFDSIASDFNLEFQEDIGSGTEYNMNSLERELNDLRVNCSAISVKCDKIEVAKAKMPNSKSDYSVSAYNNNNEESRLDGSTPDLKMLQRPSQQFWRVTNFDSPFHSSNGRDDMSLSPVNDWRHDLKKIKYKIALSSQSTSECGGDLEENWEWDAEEFLFKNEQLTTSMGNHQKWLPENADKFELDWEAELNLASSIASGDSTRNGSRRTSFDSSSNSYVNKVRLPPSGRSSVDKGSGDTPRQSINHEALVRSFGVYPDRCDRAGSVCSSNESGYQEGAASLESSTTSSNVFTSSIVTLSPVHEAKEPCPTPVKTVKKKVAKKHLKFNGEDDDDVLKIEVEDEKK